MAPSGHLTRTRPPTAYGGAPAPRLLQFTSAQYGVRSRGAHASARFLYGRRALYHTCSRCHGHTNDQHLLGQGGRQQMAKGRRAVRRLRTRRLRSHARADRLGAVARGDGVHALGLQSRAQRRGRQAAQLHRAKCGLRLPRWRWRQLGLHAAARKTPSSRNRARCARAGSRSGRSAIAAQVYSATIANVSRTSEKAIGETPELRHRAITTLKPA